MLPIFGNFWAILELVILTGVSSIEFSCYTVLAFLSLVLLHTHYHLNKGTASNFTDIKASEDTRLFVLVSCSPSSSFKIQDCCCFKNYLSFSIFSGCLTTIFAQLESTLPNHCCLFMSSCMGFFI